ncbi:CBS domain containing-hemolysin-like protein [Prosthecobacter fusiformis]|uniref:CBS domain containing-hemolysin-like protein n=1 Tax=Prosthecobacter fusiformis TaxID=48464 RepID=A0A4R7S5M4_9BACT|nr:CNNM domain-containing protein [Prosthecobacter fusiformis]TDU73179.1 CBS domain containing-hemolysin-like protein [Prosthecobacter fusiformis]
MTWVFLLIIALGLSFALSGLESAIIAVSRVRVRHAAGAGDKRAIRLLPLVEDRDALLGAITVTNHITNLAAFLIIAWKLVRISGPWGYFIAFIIALPIFLIGLEVLPKKIFRRYPFRSLRTLTPLVLLVGLVRPLFRALADPRAEAASIPDHSLGRDDLRHQAEVLSKQGQLSPGAARLIQRSLDYRKLRTAAVMRPLTRSIALSGELPLKTALIMAREHAVTTLPVLGEQGQFVGVLDLATLPAHCPPDRLVRHHMRTLDAVHAQDSALLTLQRMRKRARTLVLVLDDKNEPVGLASEEDLLDHLMGTRS